MEWDIAAKIIRSITRHIDGAQIYGVPFTCLSPCQIFDIIITFVHRLSFFLYSLMVQKTYSLKVVSVVYYIALVLPMRFKGLLNSMTRLSESDGQVSGMIIKSFQPLA